MASASSKPIINSAERMLNLVALLTESNRPLTLEDIGNYMERQYPEKAEARRTAFERDKKSLRKLGVPITMQVLGGNDAGKTAYSIDRTEYKLINFDLTKDELSALQQAAALVQIDTQWGKQAVQWLGGDIDDAPRVADAEQHRHRLRRRSPRVRARARRAPRVRALDGGFTRPLSTVARAPGRLTAHSIPMKIGLL